MGLVLIGILSTVLAACQFLPGQGETNINISFVTGTDQVIDGLTIQTGQTIDLPEINPRDGYDFVGWYMGETVNSSRVYDETQFYVNTTIFARWQEKTTTSVTRTIPIYQGMSFESTPERTSRTRTQVALNTDISDIIEIIPTEYVAFFANPGEEVLLTVNLYNPDKLVILRFTLNGQVYQNYEFQDGSNSEKLILKVKAGQESGIQSFTIDEIKYIDDADNNTIKDVIFSGEKTIKLGVTHQVLPTANITNQSVTHESIQLAINTKNENDLIQWEISPMRIFLFENDVLIQHKPLVEGNQVVQFDGLMPNRQYQYIIAAGFDALNGNGPTVHTLSSEYIQTEAAISIMDEVIGYDHIQFDIEGINQLPYAIQGVYLYQNNQLKESLTAFDVLQFIDLNANSEYVIHVHYTFGALNTNDVLTYTFNTLSRQLPTFTMSTLSVTQTGYTWSQTLIDPDQSVMSISQALYDGENFVRELNPGVFALGNLLSNRNYTIRTTISYNLFDGNGMKLLVQEHTFKTFEKQAPEVGIDYTVSSTQLEYVVVSLDVDNVLDIDSVRIYQQSTLIAFQNGLSTGVFNTLKANTNYTLRLTYTYDLNDGLGIQTKVINHDFITAKITPDFVLNTIFVDHISVQFEIIISDINSTGQIDAIRLYENGTIVRNLTNLSLRELTLLKSNQNYQLMVLYRYDLNDGLGSKVITKTVDFKTTKQLPSINVSYNSNQSAIQYTTDIQDKDLAGALASVQLFKGAELIETKNTTTDIFTSLLSNSEYRLVISYQYDLLDGQGNQVLESSHSIRTGVMPTPEVTLLTETTDTTINYNFVTSDTTNTLVITQAYLYKGVQLVQVGNLNNKVFTALNSNTEYIIRYEYRYNLNDGLGDQVITKDVVVVTSPAVPKVTIVRTSISTSAVSFDLFVNDLNAVGQIDSIRLYLGEMIVSELTNLSYRSFNELQPNTNYQIRVTYRYDLNDGKGSQAVVFKHDFTTTKRQPTMDFEISMITQDAVAYAVFIEDLDQAGSIHSITLSQGQVVDTNAANEREFYQLLSNNTYYITIDYRFDLNDGLGMRSIVVQKSFRTLPKAMPQGEIHSTQSTVDSISFDYSTVDMDHVSTLKAIELYLYGIKVQTLENLNQKTFNHLLSNNIYTIRLVYVYDLNDGLGERTYTVSKEVQTQSKLNPVVNIIQSLGDYHTITFDYTIEDLDQVGSLFAIRLLSGITVVSELSNFNVKLFEDLYTNSYYTIQVVYEYDLNDGVGVRYLEVNETVQTKAKLTPQIQTNITNLTDIGFTYDYTVTDIDQVGHLESVELYLGNQLIETRNDGTNRIFTGLLSNNTYKLVINYEYDLLDGQGIRIYQHNQTVTTIARGTPEIYLDALQNRFTSVQFTVKTTNENQLVSLDLIEIIHDNAVVASNQLSDVNVTFADLLSNTNYQIKVYYQYNLNDGKGIQSGVFETFIRTNTYPTPAITFENLVFTASTIQYELTEIDPYLLGSLIDVKLYQNDVLVQTLATLQGTFTDLLPDMTYQVVVSYQYDLNDGKGLHEVSLNAEAYTLPYLDLISTQIINTGRITEGDKIVLEIVVDNPSEIVFTRVMINGEFYDVSDTTTLDEIRVEFFLDASYTGGVTPFVVERIEGYRGSDLRVFLTEENNVGSAFVNGDILVESIEIVDENDNPLDVVSYQQKFFIKIVFNNPSQYDIDYVRVEGYPYSGTYTQFNIDDTNQTVLIERISTTYNTTYTFTLQEFSYSDDQSSKQKNVSGYSDRVTAVIDLEPTLIYNANDLASVQSGKSYKLANDIYLTNITWIPKDVSYITLDGNGFTIYDLRFVRTDVDTDIYLGLFRNIHSSIVKNINISNALIIMTLNNSTTSNSFGAEVGLLASYIGSSNISNVTVDGEISITNTTNGHIYMGGLVGRTDGTEMRLIYSNTTLVSNKGYVGGLVGYANNTLIDQVYTQGKVTGNFEYAGGVAGMHPYSQTSNAGSSMNFEGTGNVGGLLGYAYNSSLSNAYYSGRIATQNYSQAGLILSGWNNEMQYAFNAGTYTNGTLIADYSNSTKTGVYNTNDDYNGAIKTTLSEINTIMSENWNLNIWDFSGTYPQIQWKPHIRISSLTVGKTDVSFDIYTTNFNQSNTQTLVQIFEGDVLEKELLVNKTARIEGLMYNTTYTVKVSYTYSYGSDNIQVVTNTFEFTTLPAENTPEVVIQLGDVFDTHLTFDFTYLDEFNYGQVDSIYITDEQGTVVNTLSDLTLRKFGDLLPNTLYQLIIKVTYDLGDGYGEQAIHFNMPFRTTPTVAFTGVTILNQSAIVTGDRLTLQVNMDNNLLVDFTQVQINGTWYPVASSNAQRFLVYVPIVTEMGVGDKTFTIESVQGLYENRMHTFVLLENNTFNTMINGEFYVISTEFYSTNMSSMEYILQGIPFNIVLEVYNPSKYDVKQVYINTNYDGFYANQITMNEDKTRIIIPYVTNRSERLQVTIQSIVYSNIYVGEQTKNVYNQWATLPIINNDQAIMITTPTELQNMESGKYYQLANDIDLQGFNWTPINNFYGVLDGNGYSIQNLIYIKTASDETMYAGLFERVEGAIIKNLTIKDFNLLLISTSQSSQFSVYGGLLAGYINNSTIENVQISGIIEVDNITNGTNYVGLLSGSSDRVTVNHLSVSGSITAAGYAGGLIGLSYNSDISDVYASTDIISKNTHAANLIAHGGTLSLTNVYVTGTMSHEQSWVQASIGYLYSSNLTNVIVDVNDKLGYTVQPLYSNDANNRFSNTYSTYTGGMNDFTKVNTSDIPEKMNLWDKLHWYVSAAQFSLKQNPWIEILDVTPSIYGVTFELREVDKDNVGTINNIYIYKAGQLYRTIEALDQLVFDNLKYSTDYELVIEYVYDYQDGFGAQTVLVKQAFRTLDNENSPEISIDQVSMTTTSIDFQVSEIDGNNIGEITKVELFELDGTLISTTTADNLSFNELLSNHFYVIRVTYEFDYLDSFGPTEIVKEKQVKTNAKTYPRIDWLSAYTTHESMTLNFTENDPEELGQIKVVHLYDWTGKKIQTIDNSQVLKFSGLYSNKYYNMVVEYQFDLNDGFGIRVDTYSTGNSTSMPTMPTVNMPTLNISKDSVVFRPKLSDPFNIGQITKVEFIEDSVVKNTFTTVTDFEITNLLPDTNYRIKVTYVYNLNDLTGNKTGIYTYDFTTAPAFSVISTDLMNTEAVIIGDYLVFNIGIENPNNILIQEVKINGVKYAVSTQNTDSIKVNVAIDETLGVGDTELKVEAVYGTYNGILYTYNILDNNAVSKFINGDIRITDFKLTNLNGSPFEFGIAYSTNYLMVINLYNPTGYTINQITVYENGSRTYYANQFVVNEDNTQITIQSYVRSSNHRSTNITQFIYSNDQVFNRVKNVSGMIEYFSVVTNTTPIEIRTVSDLQNMQSGNHYRLMNDIDLAGINWQPKSFSGILDGNHYTISNLKITRSYNETNVYLGLFSTLTNSTVKNLILDNVEIYATVTGNSGYYTYVGGLAGQILSYSLIENVHVSGDLTMNNVTTGNSITGLLAGHIEYTRANNVSTQGSVESKNYVGGLFGQASYSNIQNAYTNVQFKSTNYGYAGGLVGYLYSSTLQDAYSKGTMNAINNSTEGAGSLVGYNPESNISNVFGQVKTINGTSLTVVHSISRYPVNAFDINSSNKAEVLATMKSVWDQDVWSFGREYPFFKQSPIISLVQVESTTEQVSFNIDLIDPTQIATIDSVELYQNGVLKETKESSQTYEFEGLRYSTTFVVKVMYTFDYLDGNGPQTVVYEKEVSTQDMPNVPVVNYTDVIVTNESVSFDLDILSTVENSYIDSIQLIDENNQIVQTWSTGEYVFTGLYSDTRYTIITNYIYDFGDGFGSNVLASKHSFKTATKTIPTGSVNISKQTSDGIEFSYTLNDVDDTVVHIDFELYLDGIKVTTISSNEVLVYTGLYSNTQYEIKMVITYDLNNQLGEMITSSFAYPRTEQKITPTASFQNIVITTNSIVFNAVKSDVNNIGQLVQIQLFQGQTLVKTVETDTVEFMDLLPFTPYNVVATYEYDKNDRNGVQTFQISQAMYTNPEFSIDSTVILNTGAIMVGEVLYFEINITNPQGIVIDEARINGNYYAVDYISDTQIRVDVPVDDKFTGGDTLITIEQLMGTKNGVRFYISPIANHQVNTFINGTIYVTNVRLFDENNQPLTFNAAYETYTVEVEFYNPTGYDINRIDYNTRYYGSNSIYNTSLQINENKTIVRFNLTTGYYSNDWGYYDSVNVTKFNYSNSRITSRDRVVSIGDVFYSVLSNESITPISTAQELQNIQSGYRYVLTNDIDLIGFEWTPIQNFKGILDGNGYNISNLNIVRTYEDENMYLGLFGRVYYSTITNLTLDNFNIIATLNTFSGNSYSVYAGGLAGFADVSTFSNIALNGNVTVNNKTNGDVRIGGLVGHMDNYNNINLVDLDVTVESKTSNSFVGGLVGYVNSYNKFSNITIQSQLKGFNYVGGLSAASQGYNKFTDIQISTNIQGVDYLGGLTGTANRNTLSNVSVVATIVGKYYVGGIIGQDYNSNILNVYSNMSINSSSNYSGGLYGETDGTVTMNAFAIGTVTNTYSVGISGGYNYNNPTFTNVYSYVKVENGGFVKNFYSISNYQPESYTTVYDSKSQTKTISEIIAIMSTRFDSSIWDFENPIDDIGNPSLK